jgi:hypothetical protein
MGTRAGMKVVECGRGATIRGGNLRGGGLGGGGRGGRWCHSNSLSSCSERERGGAGEGDEVDRRLLHDEGDTAGLGLRF